MGGLVPEATWLRHDDSWPLLCSLIRSAVNDLDEDEKYVIHEIYWSDRGHGEIAYELECSWQVIKRVEQQALARLAREIAPIARIIINGGGYQ